MSLWNWYSHTTDAVLHRDFSQFKEDGINVIAIPLYWYRLEGPIRGNYDGEFPDGTTYGKRFLDNVKRVIRIASEYEISVLVDIHTLWLEEDDWSIPDYVIDPVTGKNTGLAIVRSEDMKQAFLDMFVNTIEYLATTEGIWAWAILNEPWYWPHKLPSPYENVDQKENFIDLFQKTSGIIKALDGRAVTVKFPCTSTHTRSDGTQSIKNIFVEDWNWDERIFASLDFISFNAYIPSNPDLYQNWLDFLNQNVVGCHERKTKVWISEFGFKSDDDTTQASMYEKTLGIYEGLQLEGWIAWDWRSDNPLPNPDTIGGGWNLCATTSGEPRPAYYKLVESNPKP